jgi:hypothetical protein
MIKRKWVVLYNHPYYPEIHLFDEKREAFALQAKILSEDHQEGGHHNSFVYVGELEGIYTEIKTYF